MKVFHFITSKRNNMNFNGLIAVTLVFIFSSSASIADMLDPDVMQVMQLKVQQ